MYQQFFNLNNNSVNQYCSGLYQISWPFAFSVVVENNPLAIAPIQSIFIGVRDTVNPLYNAISNNVTGLGGLPDSSVGNWVGIIWYPNLASPPNGNFGQVYYVDSVGHQLTIRFFNPNIIASMWIINEFQMNNFMTSFYDYNNQTQNEYLFGTATNFTGQGGGPSVLQGNMRNLFVVVNGTASVTVIPAVWSIS